MTSQKSVLIVHPQFDVFGGAELVASEIIEWLLAQPGLALTLLTLRPPNPRKLRTIHGSSDWLRQVRIMQASQRVGASSKAPMLVQLAVLHRAARRLAREFDLLVSTYNEVDFGRPGFQYIHHPVWASKSVLRRHKILLSPTPGAILRCAENTFTRAMRAYAVGDENGIRRNITAVNSEFMQSIVEEVYGLESTVLYPAVSSRRSRSEFTSWTSRPRTCLTVGRITPEKNLEDAVRILEDIHRRFGRPVRTAIAGIPVDQGYERELRNRMAHVGEHFELHRAPSRIELNSLMESAQFYLHTKENEHFGIAVVEAIRRGCIPIVHDSGGMREVVPLDRLRFLTHARVPRIMKSLWNDSETAENISRSLQEHSERFSRQAFHQGLEATLGTILPT